MKHIMFIIVMFSFISTCFAQQKDEVYMKAESDAIAINNPALWPKPENPVSPGSESVESLKIVKRMFEAYSKDDTEALRHILAEDIEWYIPGRHPLSGTKKGINEVVDFFKKLQIAGFKAEVMILAANKNYVIDAHRGWSTTGKDDIDLNWILLYQIENGKIKRVQNFSGDLYTSDAFFRKVYGY